jgi:ribosomal-protein-alanine N-acetyltransferase
MINKIDIKDSDYFYKLGKELNNNFNNLYNLDELLKSKYDFIYGYYIDDNLVGFIHINKLYENMDIVNIVVSKEYRNKGIGTKLLNYTVDNYKDINNIMLEVRESNNTAIDFYKKNNFKIINVRKKYYGNEDALIMKRDVINEEK